MAGAGAGNPHDACAGGASRCGRRRREHSEARDSSSLARRTSEFCSLISRYCATVPAASTCLLLVILLVVVSDSGAYFVGMYLGRTKLAPNVSPNKTVEGAAGGLIATMAAGLLLFQIRGGSWDTGPVLLFSAMISLLAQLGDLAGSALKRAAGVKDSGWIFPGHGGLLDRTCSLVFAVVFAYYWSR